MKICIKCKEEKELIDFYKAKDNKDGLSFDCKICYKLRTKKYYEKNKEKFIKNKIIYYEKNKEEIRKKAAIYYENNKEELKKKSVVYYENNKEKVLKRTFLYSKNKRQTNPLFKLKCNTTRLILGCIKGSGYSKKSRTYEILGCSFEEFKTHLQSQFTKGMNWQNQGQWHMDHIYPTSLAKDEEELIKLNHYTNFQPLWAIDNIRKGNKIIEKQLTLI